MFFLNAIKQQQNEYIFMHDKKKIKTTHARALTDLLIKT